MKHFLKENQIENKENLCLSKLTGLGQGGVLPLVVYPKTVKELELIVNKSSDENLAFDVFGGLTNTYLSSTFSRDVIIITTRMRGIIWKKKSVIVESGYNLTKLARELSLTGISGYDGFIGIPGTVGSAEINNSGAFNASMEKVVRSVKLLDGNNNYKILSNKELLYSTRSSILKGKRDFVLLEVELDISHKEDIQQIKERIQKQTYYRKHIIDGKRKSLGTVFVAATMSELFKRNKIAMTIKKIINLPLKLIFKSQTLNTYLDFLFLGHPELAKHCDRLNRFAWDKETKESDFFEYIETMQKLADNKLKLEIEIRK